ncbi:uncharacterized protein, partial [Typha latifolia]|uniref:uncharacterized protein n=1 Tax=Typha latifolia TaxID=4733 RepID=UPI003C2B9999
GGKVKVELGGGDDNGEWLGCEFGEQPWVVTVVSSKVVVSVDLRFSDGRQNKVLAKVEMPSLFDVSPSEEKNDQFLAFCKADYNNFHMSLVTERLLFLFDLRNPLVPVLTWDHGLDNPRFIAMFRLLDLRPSDEFKWASESGFAILVGSFGNNEFNLFCYGPKEKASSNDPSLYAWELPSCLSLSGQSFAVGDNLIKDIFLGEISTSFSDCQQRKDMVVGFCILPDNLSIMESSSGGFALIRVMSSGKLEMQRYDAVWDLSLEKRLTPCFSRSLKNIWSQDQNKSSHPDHQNKTQENRRSNTNQPPNSDSKQKIHKHYTAHKGSSLELRPLLIFCEGKEERISTRYDFLKLGYLFEYMNGNLSNAITTNNAQLDSKEAKQITLGDGIRKLVKDTQNSSTSSLSSVLSDASIPTSIFEIASRRMLNCLQLDLLSLAFSTYSDLFGNPDYSFEFLEVPSCLPHNQFRPFFVGKPSRRGEKWSSKASSDDGFVGPVLPIPVLVTLHEIDYESNNSSFLKEKLDGDLLSLQCKEVLENVFSETEISIADTDNCKEWSASQELHDEKPFFIYEPVQSGSRCKITAKKVVQEEQSQANRLFETCSVIYKDEKFTTFIGGIVDKTSNVDNGHAQLGSHIFDMSPVRLDFDSSDIVLQPAEQKIFKCLKRQFVKWQENYKPYQDFCTSSKLPKSAH